MCNARLSRPLGLALFLFTLSLAAPAQPLFPPGVALERFDERDDPPPPFGYDAEFIRIDWTHPLLAADVVNHLAGGAAPPAWSEADRKTSGRLRIQLAAPLSAGAGPERWRPALPLIAPADLRAADGANDTSRRVAALAEPFLLLAGARLWLPVAPGAPELAPPPLGPREQTPALVGLRWLGTASTLDRLPDLPLDGRALLSLTSPLTGLTRFVVVAHRDGSSGETGDLVDWLRLQADGGDWIALHDVGPGCFIGQGDWRLTAPGNPRRVERLGITLELRPHRPGELIDWTRMAGCTVRASSSERDFDPARATRGHLLPFPFSPPVWISRAETNEPEPPWFEVRLGDPRPVERIELFWPSAVGFSGQFNPGRVRVHLQGPRGLAAEEELVLDNPEGPHTLLAWDEPRQISAVTLIFDQPSRMPLDRRARLAGLRLWGPWDGSTPALP